MTTNNTRFTGNRKYPNPITVTDDPKSHTLALQQIIEALNIGQRRTKDISNSFVRLSELQDLGLIEIVGSGFNPVDSGTGTGTSNVDVLNDLSDVNTAGVADGDTIIYDAATETWLPGAPGTAFDPTDMYGVALNDLSDVSFYLPRDKDVLTYNAATGTWDAREPYGRHAIWVSAGAMLPSASVGCQPLSNIASAANQPDIMTLNFDATTQEYAQFAIRMPKSWDEGTVYFRALWSHPSTTTNFGVVWGLQGVALSDGDAIAAAFGSSQVTLDTGGTTDTLYVSAESPAITLAGSPQPSDLVCFRVSRVTGNGWDSMAVDARLHGIVVYIRTDALTDD